MATHHPFGSRDTESSRGPDHHVQPSVDASDDDTPLEGEFSAEDVVPQEATQDEIDEQVHQLARMQNLGLQRILLPENATRATAIAQISQNIPQNEYGLPIYFYRSDMLPHDLSSLTQDDVDAAAVDLSYHEGYPTFGNGKIFWYQLPHEPMSEFFIFQKYLDQAESIGLRQLQLLSMEQNIGMDRIFDLSREYYWHERARAYDIFQIAADRKRREIASRKVQTKHQDAAAQVLAQILRKFEDPDYINSLSPENAINALALLSKMERVSVGLASNGNAGNQSIDPSAGASGAQLLKELTKSLVGDGDGLGVDNNLKALLQDPKFALNAQALVIQVRSTHTGIETPVMKNVTTDGTDNNQLGKG